MRNLPPIRSNRVTWAIQLAIGLLFLAFFQATATKAVAQSRDFRDLGPYNTPDPGLLLKRLAAFQSTPTTATPIFSEIQKAGKDIFQSLSPKEQQQAREFAEKLIRNKGFESPQVQTLMDQMGVDEGVRKQLAEQFKNSEFEQLRKPTTSGRRPYNSDRRRFEKALEQSEFVKNSELTKLWGDNQLDLESQQSPLDRSQSADPNNAPPKFNDWNSTEKPNSSQRSNRSNSNQRQLPVPGQLSDEDMQKIVETISQSRTRQGNRDNTRNRTVPTTDPNSPTDTSELIKQIENVLKDQPDVSKEQIQQLVEKASQAQQKSNRTTENPGSRENSERTRNSQPTASNRTDPNSANRRDTNQPSNRRTNGSDNNQTRPKGQFSDEEFAKEFHELAKDVLPRIGKSGPGSINMERLKELKELIKETSANNDDNSLGAWMKRGSDFLAGNRVAPVSKEKIEARFDRLLFDMAKKSIKTVQDNKDDPMVRDTFNSVVDSVLDSAKSGIKKIKDDKKKERQRANNNRDSNNRQSQDSMVQNVEQLLNQMDDQRGNRSSDRQSSATSPPSSGSSNNRSSSISPADLVSWIDSTTVLYGAALLAVIAVLLVVFVKAKPEEDPREIHKKQLAKKLRSAMRQPDDLVDAVDLYLLAHHGSESSWWNAQVAESVVTESKPQLRERIIDLFQLYVSSRYSKRDRTIDEQDRQTAESTLKTLAYNRSSATENGTSTGQLAVPSSGVQE
ncbi:MAG: hypothetical protein AAFN77_22210 [Planctomycetota bacterium]